MAKKEPTTLTSRLKKQYGGQPPKAGKASAPPTAPSEAIQHGGRRPKSEAKQSILTPSYIVQAKPDESPVQILHCKYMIPVDLNGRLPEVLKDASPFSSPLSASKLIDLVFCEIQKSSTLQKRLRDQRDQLTLGKYRRTSTLVLPDYICNYLMGVLDATIQPSVSLFLTWCVLDWPFIKTHVTYRGLK